MSAQQRTFYTPVAGLPRPRFGMVFAPPPLAAPHNSEESGHAQLGARIFHHRHHRRSIRLYRHRGRRGGNREDPVRRIRRAVPGLVGRGAPAPTVAVAALARALQDRDSLFLKRGFEIMTLKLCSIAAALALAFATGAQAQSTTQNTTSKDTTKASQSSADRKVKNAEEDRVEADYKAAKAKCDPMKGNQKDVCEKEAKAQEKVAKAELDAKKDPSPRNQRKVAEAKADGEYDVAKEKCDDMKGSEKNACQKQAKAKHEQAQADIKKQYAQKDAKSSSTSGSTTK